MINTCIVRIVVDLKQQVMLLLFSSFNCGFQDNGSSLVGSLYFNYSESNANRDPILSGSRVILYYHMTMLDTIVNMLRNEDSVYLFYNIDAKLGYLNTGKEEVGEEES